MSDSHSKTVSRLDQAMTMIDKLEKALRRTKSAERVPIAIVGMGCRFPKGAHSPSAFQEMLTKGVDGIGRVPGDRPNRADWRRVSDHLSSDEGGFLDHVDRFDASFFEIPSKEAVYLDPQHRLMMEVAWETLENAHINPDTLRGSNTGVYVALSTFDYMTAHTKWMTEEPVSPYFGIGNSHAAACGRLSYFFGLHGPSCSFDTACSSSLVAIDNAVSALRRRECSAALVAAGNLILTPDLSVSFSQAGMLAPDGRCKTFSDQADGYVRSDGVGAVFLKRLDDAQRDGDPIHAVIMGTAVNQDGTSNGLTAPNGSAQEAVIKKALHNAGVSPSDVSYVETHGTGTRLGDPIELAALHAVYGHEREKTDPLLLGSVKTAIGHCEATAGMAGLFKLIFAVRDGAIAPNLHFKEPSRVVPWERYPFEVVDQLKTWPVRGDGPRIGAVSAFGFGGTNGHLIVRSHDEAKEDEHDPPRWPVLLTLSAKTQSSLMRLRERYKREIVAHDPGNVSRFIEAANAGRAQHRYRYARVCDNEEEVLHHLDHTHKSVTDSEGALLEVGFIFEDWGIADPHEEADGANNSVYVQTLQECAFITRRLSEAKETLTLEERTIRDQVARRFARTLATVRALMSQGVRPAFIMGRGGLGDIIAGHVAGLYTLENACALSFAWGCVVYGKDDTQRYRDAFVKTARDTTYHSPKIRFVSSYAERSFSDSRYVIDWLAGEAVKADIPVKADAFYVIFTGRSDGTHHVFTQQEIPHVNVRVFQKTLHNDFLEALGAIWVRGGEVDLPGRRHPDVTLPTYPFEGSRYWYPDQRKEPLVAPDTADFTVSDTTVLAKQWVKTERVKGDEALKPLLFVSSRALTSDGEALAALIGADKTFDAQHWLADVESGKDFTKSSVVFDLGSEKPSQNHDAEHVRQLLDCVEEARKAGVSEVRLLTEGALVLKGDQGDINSSAACLFGAAKALSAECPEIFKGVCDLPNKRHENTRSDDAAALRDFVRNRVDNDVVALRKGVLFALRLVPVLLPEEQHAHIHSHAEYVVTGAFGALGLAVSHWLVARGARRLILVSRSGPVSQDAQQAVSRWRADGLFIKEVRADIADQPALTSALYEATPHLGRIRGVFNAAGLLGDVSDSLEQTVDSLSNVLRPKVQGTRTMLAIFADVTLDYFVNFSSISSVWGSARQVAYTAANHYLDAICHAHQPRAFDIQNVNWGPWAEGGMGSHERAEAMLFSIGISPLKPTKAIALLDRLLGRDGEIDHVIAAVEWNTLVPVVTSGRTITMFDDLIDAPKAEQLTASLLDQCTALTPHQRKGFISERLRSLLLTICELPSDYVMSDHQGLRQLGLNSLMSIAFVTEIEKLFGVKLSPTIVFDYPTIADLSDHIMKTLFRPANAGNDGAKAPVRSSDVASPACEPSAQTAPPLDVDDLDEAEAEALLMEKLGL